MAELSSKLRELPAWVLPLIVVAAIAATILARSVLFSPDPPTSRVSPGGGSSGCSVEFDPGCDTIGDGPKAGG